jgi:hypothetical protein
MNYARVYYLPNAAATQAVAGDLVFAHGGPLLVRNWRKSNGRRVPDDCVPLDATRLHRASSNGTVYRYEGPLEA